MHLLGHFLVAFFLLFHRSLVFDSLYASLETAVSKAFWFRARTPLLVSLLLSHLSFPFPLLWLLPTLFVLACAFRTKSGLLLGGTLISERAIVSLKYLR